VRISDRLMQVSLNIMVYWLRSCWKETLQKRDNFPLLFEMRSSI
jgi:hypothetical protein